jgi:hypothetical protein
MGGNLPPPTRGETPLYPSRQGGALSTTKKRRNSSTGHQKAEISHLHTRRNSFIAVKRLRLFSATNMRLHSILPKTSRCSPTAEHEAHLQSANTTCIPPLAPPCHDSTCQMPRFSKMQLHITVAHATCHASQKRNSSVPLAYTKCHASQKRNSTVTVAHAKCHASQNRFSKTQLHRYYVLLLSKQRTKAQLDVRARGVGGRDVCRRASEALKAESRDTGKGTSPHTRLLQPLREP